MRIRWKSIIPALGTLVGVVTRPEILGLVSDRTADYILAASAALAVVFPAIITDRPKIKPKSEGFNFTKSPR